MKHPNDPFDRWLFENAPEAPKLSVDQERALEQSIALIPNRTLWRSLGTRWIPSLALAAGLMVVWVQPKRAAPTQDAQAIHAIATAYDAWIEEEQSRGEEGYLLTVLDLEDTDDTEDR